MKTVDERFDAKMAPPNENGCRLWTAATNGVYGKFYINRGTDGRLVFANAHVYALTRAAGPRPPGMNASHLCHVALCVEPTHLVWESHLDNMRRDPRFANRTRCRAGHALSADNVYIPPGTEKRVCRICLRRNKQAHTARAQKAREAAL